MGNSIKGEVNFSASGKDWTLKLSTNAMCALESATGKSINEFAEGLGDVKTFRIADLRLIVCSMLNGSVDENGAGDLIDDVGMEGMMDLVSKAFDLAFPEAKEGQGKPRATA